MEIKNEYGKCEYAFEKDALGDYVHIYNLFVFPEYRKQGKAKELLQIAIEAIRKAGHTKEIQIVAQPMDSSINKEKLISFYRSIGLEVFDCYA